MNISPKAKVFYLCSAFLISVLIGYFVYTDNSTQYILILRQILQEGKQKLQEKFLQKKFIYLVQTEQCLNELMMQKEYLSNSSECQCDVIVYSYKEKCLDSQHEHIVYVYEENSTSTLNTGRNHLYRIARYRKVFYLYYIFLDGDIKLEYNEKIAPETMMSISPLRSFEQFLIEHEPGIGIVDFSVDRAREFIIQKIQKNCNLLASTNLSNRTSTDSLYLTTAHFDALFNAFHRDIIDHVLPYILDYDDRNWHVSQMYLVSAVELKFRGQVILFAPVIVYNPEHHEYPKGVAKLESWAKCVEVIVSTMPEEYQGNELVKRHMENPIHYLDDSLTVCFKRPIQDSFKMYSHFGLNWLV